MNVRDAAIEQICAAAHAKEGDPKIIIPAAMVLFGEYLNNQARIADALEIIAKNSYPPLSQQRA